MTCETFVVAGDGLICFMARLAQAPRTTDLKSLLLRAASQNLSLLIEKLRLRKHSQFFLSLVGDCVWSCLDTDISGDIFFGPVKFETMAEESSSEKLTSTWFQNFRSLLDDTNKINIATQTDTGALPGDNIEEMVVEQQTTESAAANPLTPLTEMLKQHDLAEEHKQVNNNQTCGRYPEFQRVLTSNEYERDIDLNKWRVKFDGSDTGLSVDSFIFRIEKLKALSHITYDELFAQFHCLVIRKYWQLLEDHENDLTFGYVALKKELLKEFGRSESDYDIIRDIMERKQQPFESFDEYYGDIHDLRFRMKNKMPEFELIKVIKSNLRAALASLIFAIIVDNIADLRAECKRAEKFLRENRQKYRQINEIECWRKNSDLNEQKFIETFELRNTGKKDKQKQKLIVSKESGKGNSTIQDPNIVQAMVNKPLTTSNRPYCHAPFHASLCSQCHMPANVLPKNRMLEAKQDKCRNHFHEAVCSECGRNESHLQLQPQCSDENREPINDCPPPQIRIMQRPNSQPITPKMEPRGREIFHQEIVLEKYMSKKYKKILKLREKQKVYRQFKRDQLSTIVTLDGDNRLFAKSEIDGINMTALLDTGASVSSLGAGAQEFLRHWQHKIVKLRNQFVKGVNGDQIPVKGIIMLGAWASRAIKHISPASTTTLSRGINI
uniref:Peptidase A2 domain-containing protein n=1 Tax=Glossina brevipalpis TaxID=37001 RepID=A0A1A9WIZ0_9MUSC